MKRYFTAICLLFVWLAITVPASAEPLAYPWSTWGEVSNTWDDASEGVKLDGYVEQGIDWFKLGSTDWVCNTFAGLRFTQSDRNDYWDNKVGPWVGLKMKHAFKPFDQSWGEIAIGVRAEYYAYTRGEGSSDELRGVVFSQWSFGGDWKKKQKGGD